MRTILKEARTFLESRGIVFPDREAEDILMDMLGESSRAALGGMNLSDDQLREYWRRLYRRGSREPTAYIHGSVNFLGLVLRVSPAVLIPRQETELLAERIISYLHAHPSISLFYDVCCGSGCLGLAIQRFCPWVTVVLSDICPYAVAIAKENAQRNNIDVNVMTGDLFAPFARPADAFVCNPPYLSFREIMLADPEVRCHEPWKALVGGRSGLEFYQRIADELDRGLCDSGVGWLEIGSSQGQLVSSIFFNKGVAGVVYQDLAGLDRIFFLEKHVNDPVSSGGYS